MGNSISKTIAILLLLAVGLYVLPVHGTAQIIEIPEITITIGGSPVGEGVTWPYPNGPKTDRFQIPTYRLIVQAAGNPEKYEFDVFRFGVMQKENEPPKVVGMQDAQTHIIEMWLPEYKVHSQASVETGAWKIIDNFLIHDGPDDPKDSERPFATIGCIEICGEKKFDEFNDLLLRLANLDKSDRAAALNKVGQSKRIRVVYEKSTRPELKKLN